MLNPVSIRRIRPIAMSLSAAAILLISAAAAPSARAQLAFTLSPNAYNIAPGGTVTFSGTLTNTGTSTIYLNSLTFNFATPDSSTYLSMDTSPFDNSSALVSLTAGNSYTGELFLVTVASNAPSEIFSGTAIIQGGATSSALNDLASQTFQVSPLASANAAEPSSLLLFPIGLLAGASAGRRRSAKRPRESARIN